MCGGTLIMHEYQGSSKECDNSETTMDSMIWDMLDLNSCGAMDNQGNSIIKSGWVEQ